VQWQDHQQLAIALRDQGLADCLTARYCLREDTFKLFETQITLAHVVVAKCQQSVEKVIKGFLLWLTASFDPTKGHTPFSRQLENDLQQKHFDKLVIVLNRLNSRIVSDIKWLETLAPHPPDIPVEQKGQPQSLKIILENSEYPYWSKANNRLWTSAEGISPRDQGARAFKTLRTFLTALSRSDPPDFTKPITEFLEHHRMPTEVQMWPAE
jgi:hypothetical protein